MLTGTPARPEIGDDARERITFALNEMYRMRDEQFGNAREVRAFFEKMIERQAQRLRLGQPVLLRGANAPIAAQAVLVSCGSRPVGICTIEQGELKPKRLFNL